MKASSLNNQIDDLFFKAKKYLPKKEVEKIQMALDLASSAHKSQKRMSGDDFIVHPIQTAIRLAEIRLDPDAICAALLHDAIEDTNIDKNKIKKVFGPEVLSLVESVTKLGNVRIKKSWFPYLRVQKSEIPEFERQVETLRKMLVAMASDIRVILIKLADKIHNLETLSHLPEEKRERIAREAIEIYAPLAARLGMGKWKGIMEDLAFPYVLPKEYNELRALAIPKIKDREKYLREISNKVKSLLEKDSIRPEIEFRAKRWYSLYKKMQKYDEGLEKIHDLIAVRIIVSSIEECYTTLGLIHSLWKPLVGRIKDYIALPKPNGYQSLHTTVFTDDGKIVEFQIRTVEMNNQAEFGIASHWVYSEDKKSRNPSKREVQWLKDFYQIQKKVNSVDELADIIRMDLFKNRIFAFTPLGDVKDLPSGATPVDFAYSIHTDIGDKCIGAKINGKIAPLDTKLQNGDIVEILTKKSAKPHADWLNFAKTPFARGQIKRKTG